MSKIVTRIEALDLMSQLGKELVTSYEAEDATVATIVAALLAFQVLEPNITVGTISGDYSALTRSIKVDGDTILRALFRLRDTVGGYVYVDNDRKLQWASSLGEDKGQQIRYRKNLKGIERDIDYDSLINRLYCYGAGEGSARIKLSDAEGHDEDYVEDVASQGVPPGGWGGIYVGVMVDKSITHPDTLLAWANLRLAEVKNPLITYSVNTVDLSKSIEIAFDFDSLQLGSTIKIIDEELGIDVSVKVVKIEHPDLLHSERMNLELATRTKDITDALLEIYDRQQFDQHIATVIGAGQVIVQGEFTVIDWVTAGTTNIKGGYIRTGIIQSSNWAVDVGSQFNLNDGTFKLGGSAAPKLSWDGATLIVRGTVYAAAGEFTGTLKTSNIEAGKTLTVLGSISASAGKVIINEWGINLKEQTLRFFDGVTQVGYINVGALGIYIDGETKVQILAAESALGAHDGSLELYSDGDIQLLAGGHVDKIITLGQIQPFSTNEDDIGTDAKRYKDVFLSGDIYFDETDIYDIDDIRRHASAGSAYVGSSSYKFARGYFDDLPACPVATTNSALEVIRKIKAPKVRKGKQGCRFYFLDIDFPNEMTCEIKLKDRKTKKITNTGKREIELFRTVGVLTQGMRELLAKVESLEAK